MTEASPMLAALGGILDVAPQPGAGVRTLPSTFNL